MRTCFISINICTVIPHILICETKAYDKVKKLCLYIMHHVFLFSEGFRATAIAACRLPAWHTGFYIINYVHRAQGFEDVCE